MLFFSKLLGVKICDQADREPGRLIDIAITPIADGSYPPIAGIVVKVAGQKMFIDSSNIESFSHERVLLNKNADETLIKISSEQYIFLRESVLDRQIVDLSGVRVVRVNDLEFGVVKGKTSLIAIDIGNLGIIRRLGLSWLFSFLKPQLLEWKDVQLIGDKLQLSVGMKEIVKLHPADIANIIEKLNLNQQSEFLQALDKKTAARVLEELEPEIQRILVESLGPERATSILQKMSIDELVDLMQMLPDRKSKEFISTLPSDSTQKVKKILEYNEDTAGGLMTTEFISARDDDAVGQVVERIKTVFQPHHGIYFVYIVNKDNKFLGVVSMRRLLVASQEVKMSEVIDEQTRFAATTLDKDVLEVASLMTKYNLFSIAVLDENEKLLGVVTVDDVMRHFVPHA